MIQLVRPCLGRITQWFANIQSHDGRKHTGNDYGYYLDGRITDAVFAAADGVVLFAGDSRTLGWPNDFYINPDFDRTDAQDSSAGNFIAIAHVQNGIRFVTTYSHLAAWTVRAGQIVTASQRIATIGDTGFSAGKHLHFELLIRPFNFGTPTYGRTNPNPYFTIGIAAAGVITAAAPATQEDDMTPEQDAMLRRLTQIGEAQETDGLRAKVVAIDGRTAELLEVTKYVRSDHPDELSLYEIMDDGTLRGITLAEWEVTGKKFRYLQKAVIDRLLAAS